MKSFKQCLCVGILSSAMGLQSAQGAEPGQGHRPFNNTISAGIQIPFVENLGQTAPEVAFYTDTFGGVFFVTKNGELVLSLPSPEDLEQRGIIITEAFKRAHPFEPRGVEPSVTRLSYFKGAQPTKRHADVATYNRIALGDVYESVDIELHARGGSVEKLFHVQPGGDPALIAVQVSGADDIEVTANGELALHTAREAIRLTKPVAYQIVEGQKRPVSVAYRLTDDGYAFDVGSYDPRHHLVIDPLLQATYLGSSERDEVRGMARHPVSGEIYLVGATPSPAFPGTTEGAQAASGGAMDVFVARLNAGLTELGQVTYLGGGGDDEGYAITIHPDTGDVYVTGGTTSTDFPGTSGAAQPDNTGGGEAFVTRLNAGLTTLQRSTYFGGSDNERGFGAGLYLSSTGQRLYIAGDTLSDNLPGTADAPQPSTGGGWDAFVAAFDTDLGLLRRATYLGGGGADQAIAMTVNPVNGKVLVTGYTVSEDFPGTAEGAQPRWHGSDDGFVAILEPDVRELRRATYLGGGRADRPSGIALHPGTNDIYVTGVTNSVDFPVTPDGVQTGLRGMDDLFVARLDPGAMRIQQATYLGGDGNELSVGRSSIALYSHTDTVYVTGDTTSHDFPGTAGGAQPDRAGVRDAIVARLSSDLNTLEQATYLGGSGGDIGNVVTINQVSGDVYVAGQTDSSDFPGTSGGAQPASAGDVDVFVARLDSTLGAEYEWKSMLFFVAAFLVAISVFALYRGRVIKNKMQ